MVDDDAPLPRADKGVGSSSTRGNHFICEHAPNVRHSWRTMAFLGAFARQPPASRAYHLDLAGAEVILGLAEPGAGPLPGAGKTRRLEPEG